MLYTLQNGSPVPCPTDHNGIGNLRDDYWQSHGGKVLVAAVKPDGNYEPIYEEVGDQIVERWVLVIPPPVSISKIKIGDAFESMGMLDAFEAFIAADKTSTRRWRDAVVLMSDDPMVVEACKYFQSAGVVTAAQIGELLQACKSDIG